MDDASKDGVLGGCDGQEPNGRDVTREDGPEYASEKMPVLWRMGDSAVVAENENGSSKSKSRAGRSLFFEVDASGVDGGNVDVLAWSPNPGTLKLGFCLSFCFFGFFFLGGCFGGGRKFSVTCFVDSSNVLGLSVGSAAVCS